MDQPDVAAAITTLGWLEFIKRVGGFMVIAGVAIEVGGEWIAGPFHKKVEDARQLELSQLNNESARLSSEAETARAAIADANARALEAKLALEKFKAARIMSPEQQARIAAKMAKYKGLQFDAAFGPSGDPEPDLFLRKIEDALSGVGWTQLDWQTSDIQIPFVRAGRAKVGLAAVTNVFVDIHPSQAARLGPVAAELAAALNAEGFDAIADIGSGFRNVNETAIHIMVGRKM